MYLKEHNISLFKNNNFIYVFTLFNNINNIIYYIILYYIILYYLFKFYPQLNQTYSQQN